MLTNQHNFERLSSPTQQVPSSNSVAAFHEEPPVMVFFYKLERIWFWFMLSVPRQNGTSVPVLVRFFQKKFRFWISDPASSSYPANQ
jgi:hypothetical protein